MNRYSAIITSSVKHTFLIVLALVLLMVYILLLLVPNIHTTQNGNTFRYISIQFVVFYWVLLPLLINWRYCQTLYLVPGYSSTMKKIISGLFILFIIVPTWLAWAAGYNIGVLLTFTLLIWNIYSFLISRRWIFNNPALQSDKNYKQIYSHSIMVVSVSVSSIILSRSTDWFVGLNFFTTDFQIIAVVVSLLLWLIPKKTIRKKSQRKRFPFNLDHCFCVPKETKLVFGVISLQSFSSLLGTYLITFLIFIYITGHNANFAFMVIILQYPLWLKHKEKISILCFTLKGSAPQVEKIVYRAFWNTTLYFFTLTALCTWIASSVVETDIKLFDSLSMMLVFVSGVYFLLRLPRILGSMAFIAWIITPIFIQEYIPQTCIVLILFIAWTYMYPPKNWLNDRC